MSDRKDMDFATFARAVCDGLPGSLRPLINASYMLVCYGNKLTVNEAISKAIMDSKCQASNN